MKREVAIENLRDEMIERREHLRRALDGDLDAMNELSGQSGDSADLAQNASQGELNSQLAAAASRELSQLEKALKKVKDGSYGLCEATGKPIPLARLQALPYAALCIEAQKELEENGEIEGYTPDWGKVMDLDTGAMPLGDMNFA